MPATPKPMDLTDSIYRECHEHLRHADDKRDTLIGFYGVVIGLLFAAHAKDSGLEKELHLVDLVVALVGLAVCITVIQYRKWHLVYAWSFEILQRLEEKKISASQITEEWPSDEKGRVRTLRRVINPLGGTEAATFAALLVLSFVPWYLVISRSNCAPQLLVGDPGLPFVLGFITYSVVLYSTAAAIAVHAALKGPFEYWILAPFADPPLDRSNNSAAGLNKRLVVIAVVAVAVGFVYLANLSLCFLGSRIGGLLVVVLLLTTVEGARHLTFHKSPSRDAK